MKVFIGLLVLPCLLGRLDDIDREIERYQAFAAGGLTELSIRLFDDPMDGLKMIGERVLPALR